jgi:HD-like signal output (HDOD) protein
MVTKEEILLYIDKIPPIPDSVRDCIDALKQDDLTKAAKVASNDKALEKYLINIVNRASFGFANRVTDLSQIFGILGLDSAKGILVSYLISILAPSKWEFFEIDNRDFNTFQENMIDNWSKITQIKNYDDKFKIAAVLLGSAIIVSEELFKTHKRDLGLIRQTSDLSYNKILYRLCGISFVDISIMIAKEWEVQQDVLELVAYSLDRVKKQGSFFDENMAKFFHLTIFYELSKGKMLESGLNSFIDFDMKFVGDIYEEFMDIMELNNET